MDQPDQLVELYGTPLPGAGEAEISYRMPYLNGDVASGSQVVFMGERIITDPTPMQSFYGHPVIDYRRPGQCHGHDQWPCGTCTIRGTPVHVVAHGAHRDPLHLVTSRVEWGPHGVQKFAQEVAKYKTWQAARHSMLWHVDDLAAESRALMSAYPDAPLVEVLAVIHRAVHSFDYDTVYGRPATMADPLQQWRALTKAACKYYASQPAPQPASTSFLLPYE